MLKLVPTHPGDVLHCEFCPNTGLDDMHSHQDIWLCHECHAGVVKEVQSCQHEWRIEENDAGEIGVACDKCSFWKQTASSPVF